MFLFLFDLLAHYVSLLDYNSLEAFVVLLRLVLEVFEDFSLFLFELPLHDAHALLHTFEFTAELFDQLAQCCVSRRRG